VIHNESHEAQTMQGIPALACPLATSLLEDNFEDFPCQDNEDGLTFDPLLFPMPTHPSRKVLNTPKSNFQIHLVPASLMPGKQFSYAGVVLFHRSFSDTVGMLGCCSLCDNSKYSLRVCNPDLCRLSLSKDFLDLSSCVHVAQATRNLCFDLQLDYKSNSAVELAQHCIEPVTTQTGWFFGGLLEGLKFPLYVHISTCFLVSVFQYNKTGWKCHLCRKYSCFHKNSIVSFPNDVVPHHSSENVPEKDLLVATLLSHTGYKYDDSDYWNWINKRNGNFLSYIETAFPKRSNENILVFPEQEQCSCGSSFSFGKNVHGSMILGPVLVHNVEVMFGKCMSLSCSDKKNVYFDGHNYGLVNLNNKYLMDVGIIMEFLCLYAASGIAINAWWKAKCAVYISGIADCQARISQKKKLNEMRSQVSILISGFAELLVYPRSLTGCCETPKMITMDGIVLSVKQMQIPKFHSPWLTEEVSFRATTRDQRSFPEILGEEKTFVENLLKGDVFSGSDCKRFSNSKHGALRLVCQILFDTFGSRTVVVSVELRIFLKCFLKEINPAISMVPLSVRSSVEAILHFPKPLPAQDFKKLLHFSPVLLGVVEAAQKSGASMRCCSKLKLFVKELMKIVDATYVDIPDLRDYEREIPNTAQYYSEFMKGPLAELWSTGHGFPNYPPTCSLPDIKIAKENLGKQCSKEYKEKGSCGAGIVPFWCLEHRKCLGWVVLESAESPRVIANAIITRFPKAKVVMYDNGCRLHEFVLNRCPAAFVDVQVMIDILHYSNHVSCSEVYSPKTYGALIGDKSTVLCEQKNAILARLKSTAPHMKFRTFVALFQFTLMKINEDQNDRNLC
jgi:CxC4 like cysteine cluster associated with KDZ transposases